MNLPFAAYYILSNEVQARWERTRALQEKIWPGWMSIRKVFVVDRSYKFDSLLGNLGAVVRIDLFSENGHILFSKAKNAGLSWATERIGIDWLLDADADCVVVRPPDRIPETPYSSLLCHFQEEHESIEELERKAATGTLGERHFSRFLLARQIFERYRFDEEFWGYAGDDVDFHLNLIQKAGIQWSDSGARGINMYHPMGPRLGNLDRLNKKSRGLL